jgi:hypothetical protein
LQIGDEVLAGEPMAYSLNTRLVENLRFFDHVLLQRHHISQRSLQTPRKQVACPPISFTGHYLHFLHTKQTYAVTAEGSLLNASESWLKSSNREIASVVYALYFPDVEVAEIKTLLPRADLRHNSLHTVAETF